MPIEAWRLNLRPASFRGVEFKIDIGSGASGRRVALKEFPKRDVPYAEDMGRRARRFNVTGYVIGANYDLERDDLIDALEAEGPGVLVRPTSDDELVLCTEFSYSERRERGRIAEFEMTFVEAGQESFDFTGIDTQGAVAEAADTASGAVKDSLDTRLATTQVA